MLAKRVIPTLLCNGRQLMKGERFDSWRSVGVVEQAVRIHQARQVDELILLDRNATAEKRGPDLELIEELTRDCFMPLTVGGGIRNVADVRAVLKAGADKVCIGTAAYLDPLEVWRIVDAVGSQALCISIDVNYGKVWIKSGTSRTTSDPVRMAKHVARQGAGEILITSIDREGRMKGYDLDLIARVADCVDVPVIANGGCGSYADMHEAINAGASGVAAGAFFLFTDNTPKGAAEYLAAQNIETRVPEEGPTC